MASTFLTLLGALLPLLFKGLDWFFSSEQTTAREAQKADATLQNFDKALANNDAAFVTGAALDLHNRVRSALRGH